MSAIAHICNAHGNYYLYMRYILQTIAHICNTPWTQLPIFAILNGNCWLHLLSPIFEKFNKHFLYACKLRQALSPIFEAHH